MYMGRKTLRFWDLLPKSKFHNKQTKTHEYVAQTALKFYILKLIPAVILVT